MSALVIRVDIAKFAFSSPIDSGRHYPPRAGISTDYDGKIKATMSLRAVGGRKCLSAHCFVWHRNGTSRKTWCRFNAARLGDRR